MKTEYRTVESDNLQTFVETENFLLQEIEALELKLSELKSVKKHTQDVLNAIESLEKKIERDRQIIEEIQLMRALSPGQWVRNGSTKPGEITELKVSGKIPEVWVTWWGNTAPVPESPRRLKTVEPEQLNYIWNGEIYPKLIRILDKFECEDIAVLRQKLQESLKDKKLSKSEDQVEACRKQIVYCQKRIELISAREKENTRNRTVSSEARDVRQDSIQGKGAPVTRIESLNISQIKCDSRCQQRESLDPETLKDYLDIWLSGDVLPPVKVMYDGTNYWLYDGFHTIASCKNALVGELKAEVTPGTLRDAILASVGVNSNHGLRRSNETKRNAVLTMLKDEEWSCWSDREIARQCKVDHKTVGKIRKNFTGDLASDTTRDDKQIITGEFPSDKLKIYKDKHGNTSCMNVKNIGKPEKDTNNSSQSPNNVSLFLAPGSLVEIENNSRIDERLIGYKKSLAVVKARNEFSVDLSIWGHFIENVSFNDIKLAPQEISITLTMPQQEFKQIMENFDSIQSYLAWNLSRRTTHASGYKPDGVSSRTSHSAGETPEFVSS